MPRPLVRSWATEDVALLETGCCLVLKTREREGALLSASHMWKLHSVTVSPFLRILLFSVLCRAN